MRLLRSALIAAAGSVLTAGCASVPDLGPKPAMREAATVASERSLAPAENGVWPNDRWWADYGDPQLTALIEEGLRGAPDVATAAARFRRAVGLSQQAGAPLLPSLDATANVGIEKQSLNMGFPDQFKDQLPQGWMSSGRLAAQLTYELDLWGKNHAALAAATSEQRAAALDARQAQLLVASGIAAAYFDLAHLYALRDVRAGEVAVRENTAKLIAARFAHGMENRGSVAQAEAQIGAAHGQLDQVDQQVAVRRHQIAELVGAGPDRGLDITRPAAVGDPHALPAGVTTALLGRRADLVAARERAEAAAQRIKVARADFYPAIKLSALAGVQSLGLAQLFTGDSVFGNVGPAITLPIFHGGAIQGRYRVQRAEYDAAVASYDKLVLTAYREVADAVTSQRIIAQSLVHARAALASAEQSYDVAKQRYRSGLITYLDVLTVEDSVLLARLGVAELTAAARSTDLDLVRALGGGLSTDGVKEARNG